MRSIRTFDEDGKSLDEKYIRKGSLSTINGHSLELEGNLEKRDIIPDYVSTADLLEALSKKITGVVLTLLEYEDLPGYEPGVVYFIKEE